MIIHSNALSVLPPTPSLPSWWFFNVKTTHNLVEMFRKHCIDLCDLLHKSMLIGWCIDRRSDNITRIYVMDHTYLCNIIQSFWLDFGWFLHQKTTRETKRVSVVALTMLSQLLLNLYFGSISQTKNNNSKSKNVISYLEIYTKTIKNQ